MAQPARRVLGRACVSSFPNLVRRALPRLAPLQHPLPAQLLCPGRPVPPCPPSPLPLSALQNAPCSPSEATLGCEVGGGAGIPRSLSLSVPVRCRGISSTPSFPPSAEQARLQEQQERETPPAEAGAAASGQGRGRGPEVCGDEVSLDLDQAFLAHLWEAPGSRVTTSRQELWELFRRMLVVRRAEITADSLFKAQQIRGFCHLYDGQEAVCCGIEAALSPRDALITAYRDHGFYLTRHGSLEALFAELLGRAGGCAGGKGGSMHLFNVGRGFFGGWGIVGTTAPLGAGLALAQSIRQLQQQSAGEQEHRRGGDSITVAVFGDGAANQGQVYEAANMAALWRLPLVLAVENNHYGMGTSEFRASAQTTFYDRLPYMPGLRVDGMDALAVKEATLHAKQHALEQGPVVLELDTYRYHGHSMSDPGSTYRQRSEIQGVRQARDPIERVRNILLQVLGEDRGSIKAAESEARALVQHAAERAQAQHAPEEGAVWRDVYAAPTPHAAFPPDRHASARL